MKKIVIICDFNKNSGFGHLTRMRSLTRSISSVSEVVFLFEYKHKNFIQKYVGDLNCRYLNFSLRKKSKHLENYLIKNLIEVVIFDSYYISIDLEKFLYKNFFVISVDDKLSKHYSHIVLNSREDLSEKKLSKPGHLWITGKKVLLINQIRKKTKSINTINNILIHAGGSSAYRLCNEFFNTSIKYLSNKKVRVDIIYNNNKTFNYLNKKIFNLIGKNDNFKLIKFQSNFSKNLFKYDVVCGPGGTTTFEALTSGTLNFSFPLLNDGRDSILNWNLYGNILHLTFEEKKNLLLIQQLWDYIFFNFDKLGNYSKNNSKLFFNNSFNFKNLINKSYFEKILSPSNKNKNERNDYFIKKADFKYARSFLNSRNSLKVRNLSNNPNHIISFSEHLNWWSNKNIKKYILFKNKRVPYGYHWIKLIKKNNKKLIISGWFLDIKAKNSLRASYEISKHQKNIIKKKYKDYKWLININKKNNLAIRMNKSLGFKKASAKSFEEALELFKFDKRQFNVYEIE